MCVAQRLEQQKHSVRATITFITILVPELQDHNPASMIPGPVLQKVPCHFDASNDLNLRPQEVRARDTGHDSLPFSYYRQGAWGAERELNCLRAEVELGKELRLQPKFQGFLSRLLPPSCWARDSQILELRRQWETIWLIPLLIMRKQAGHGQKHRERERKKEILLLYGLLHSPQAYFETTLNTKWKSKNPKQKTTCLQGNKNEKDNSLINRYQECPKTKEWPL